MLYRLFSRFDYSEYEYQELPSLFHWAIMCLAGIEIFLIGALFSSPTVEFVMLVNDTGITSSNRLIIAVLTSIFLLFGALALYFSILFAQSRKVIVDRGLKKRGKSKEKYSC